MKQRAFDRIGNIAIVNFPKEFSLKDKKVFADKILKENKSVKTVLEKKGRIKGRLRKAKTSHISGEKTKEVLYKENNCVFRFNIESTYFSPRLSNERKEIASMIEPNQEVLVMFAGVAPFTIVIAKNSKAKMVYSNEINREANKYAEMNVHLNNLKSRVVVVPGNIKRIVDKLKLSNKFSGFDVIVMPRPQLKETFLEQAFKLSKKGTRVFYYDFCKLSEKDLIVKKVKEEARKYRKKIKIINSKKAGEIAPYKIRIRVDFEIV